MIILFFLFFIIIIIQLIIYLYFPIIRDKGDDTEEKIKFNIKNKERLENIFNEKVRHYSKQINYDKIPFNDWYTNLVKENVYDVEGRIYYVFVYEKIKNTNEMIMNLAYTQSKTYKYASSNFEFKDYLGVNSDRIINSRFTVSNDAAINMFNLSTTDKIQTMNFYWIDPYNYDSVIKKAFFSKWKTYNGREGIIGTGYDIVDLTYNSAFKYGTRVHKFELMVTFIGTFLISLLIYTLNNTKYSKIESIIYLILINIYICYFINNTEYLSNNDNEYKKITETNKSILNVSFLVAVNIYIIDLIYRNKYNNNLFKETCFIFSIAIIFLLIACFKNTNQNTIFELTSARLTNQYLFNLSIILNFLILFNFIIYNYFYL
jgi:hypothetical protein